jgi:hypothetical protein
MLLAKLTSLKEEYMNEGGRFVAQSGPQSPVRFQEIKDRLEFLGKIWLEVFFRDREWLCFLNRLIVGTVFVRVFFFFGLKMQRRRRQNAC